MNFLVFDVVLKVCLVGVLSQDILQSATQKLAPSAINVENKSNNSNAKEKVSNPRIFTNIKEVVCPDKIPRIPFLSLPCEHNGDCSIFGGQMVCCSKRCIKGITPLRTETNSVINRSIDVTTKSIPTTTVTKTAPISIKQESNDLVCPGKNVRIPFWSLQCETRTDCMIFGRKMVCCSGRCIDGVPLQKAEETKLTPIKDNQVTERKSSVDRSIDLPTKVDIQKSEVPKVNQTVGLLCPEGVRIPFFSLLCTTNADCSALGSKMICCKNRCIDGVSANKNEINGTDASKEKQQIPPNNIKERSSTEKTNTTNAKIISTNDTTNHMVCPEGVRIPFFSLPCVNNIDCLASGKEMVCCSNRCVKGVPPKKPEIIHSPSWFGLVDRKCPVDAIVEILEIKECEKDADCRPRICCPDKYHNASNKNYCRTPQPSLNRFPLADRATEPLRLFASYIQCTPPPPPIFDIFPKSCNNTLDCFPNLCCQEGDKKYCRPPKRSVLQLIAGVGQRFVPADAAKRLIERLN